MAMDTFSQKSIKVQNILQVCDSVFNKDSISRYEISQETGLSVMTVGKVAEILKQAGLISEVKDEESSVGRKAGKIRVCSDKWWVVLIDLYHEQMVFSRMPISGGQPELLLRQSYADRSCYEKTLRSGLAQLQESLAEWTGEVAGIGVLVPGPYYADKDIVINRRIPQLTGIPLKGILKEYFADLPIVIEEDVKFAAHYAIRQVEGYENKTIFYAYVGEGVGGAIVQNGQNFRSAHAYSADFGQFKLAGGVTAESIISLKRFRSQFPELYVGKPDCVNNEKVFQDYLHEIRQAIVQCLNSVMLLIDPDIILFDSEYDRLFPNFFFQLAENFYEHVTAERGQDIPQLFRARTGENALYKGARNSVREVFLRQLV